MHISGRHVWPRVRPDEEPVHAGRVNWKELKRPPGNIRRPTGLKIACFRNGPVRPGYARLAFASGARRIKNAVPSREQRNCGGKSTHSIPRICRLGLLGKCDSDQARKQQDNTCNGDSEETVRGEFFTHGTPPIARECWLPSRPASCSKRTTVTPHSQRDSAASKNRNLTDALKQQRPSHPDDER